MTAFPELRRVFEEDFGIKVHQGYVLKYLNVKIFQTPLGFSFDNNGHIMKLVNEWLSPGKFIKIDTHFITDSIYEKNLMNELPLTGSALHTSEM